MQIRALVMGLIFSAFVINVVHADTKIAVVDLQKIMQTSTQMKSIQKKLEQQFKPRRDQLVALEGGLKKDMEKFKRDSSIFSQSQKKDLEKKIVATQQKFEHEGQQYQQELSTAHNEAMEALYAKIRQKIATIAEKDHYSLVLQKDAAPFSAASLDITSSVMDSLEK